MPLPQTFETTIFEPSIRVAAEAFVLPKSAFDAIPGSPRDITDVLGLELGVPVPSPDQLPTVFFAAIAGRTATFDPGSFERWERQMEPGDPRADFARRLSFEDLMPVETSPLTKVSLASLAVRGPAWVVAGSQMWADRPFQALGIVVAGEFGAVVVGIARGFGESAAIAVKYHTRRLFKVPTDWLPPEDRT
jgi:hypothetical protein